MYQTVWCANAIAGLLLQKGGEKIGGAAAQRPTAAANYRMNQTIPSALANGARQLEGAGNQGQYQPRRCCGATGFPPPPPYRFSHTAKSLPAAASAQPSSLRGTRLPMS